MADVNQLRIFSTDFHRSVFFDPGNSLTRTPHRCLFHGFTSILALQEIKLLDSDAGRQGALLRKCQGMAALSYAPCHKDVRGNGGIDLHILSLGTRLQ